MHISNMKFAVLVTMFVAGCSLSHGRGGLPPIPAAEDGGLPFIADSGAVMIRHDAGPGRRDAGVMPMTDSGVVVTADAGSDAGTPTPAHLFIALASTPSGVRETVKKALLEPSLGITVTAERDSIIDTLPFFGTAVVDEMTGDARESLNDVITSCALFNGDEQVGLSQTPDASTGTFPILRMGLLVRAGTSMNLTVRCSMDSVVEGESDLFRIAFDPAGTADVIVVDEPGTPVLFSLGASLIAQGAGTLDTSTTPVSVRVHNTGELTVEPCDHPEWDILTAGGGAYRFLAQYCVSARYEDGMIERGSLASFGEAASYGRVAFAVDGRIRGSNMLPSGRSRSVDIDMSEDSILVPRDGMVHIQLWAMLSEVVSSASVGGATSGVARSGNVVRLGLNAGLTSGEWDPSYAGHYNLRTTGTVSGDRLRADGTTDFGGNFVVRRTQPTVSVTSSDGALVIGDNALSTTRISADPAGTVGFRRFTLWLFGARPGLTDRFVLSNFWLERDGIPVSSENVVIVDDQGHDLESSPWTTGPVAGQYVSVDLVHEDRLVGSGSTYTVHATGSGRLLSGDLFSVQLVDDGHPFSTGYVFESATPIQNFGDISGDTFVGPFLDATEPWEVSGSRAVWGLFLWSDLSEVPHSDAVRELGGSRDWIDGGLVHGFLTAVTTLTAP